MARAIIWHKVKDFDAWKTLYDADKPRRDAAGLTEISINRGKLDTCTSVNPNLNRGKLDSNTLMVEWETGDPGVMEKMMADPELKETMEKAGVMAMDYFVIQ